MRGVAFVFMGLSLAACSRGPALPEQPVQDPSSRTTTMVNPPTSPEEAAARCDVPMYPGAKAPDGRSHMPKLDNEGNLHYDLVLTSNDPYKKVAEYYGRKMKLSVVPGAKSSSIVGKTPKGNDAIIEVSPEDAHTLIRIRAIASGLRR